MVKKCISTVLITTTKQINKEKKTESNMLPSI